MVQWFDVLVVGGGIAGASVAAHLSGTSAIAIIEREPQPGYHSTGRSAALFSEIYGSDQVRALSRASRAFLFDPPAGFSGTRLVSPRGALHIARADQRERFQAFADLPDVRAGTSLVDAAQARTLSPLLRPGYAVEALHEPMARDIDVAALHQGFLREVALAGGRLCVNQDVLSLERRGGAWHVVTSTDEFAAPVLVNAAGAWADGLAARAGVAPIGLTPRRRTVVMVDAPDQSGLAMAPMTLDIDEQFYFKPDAGLLLLSPGDETPVDPCDVQPDELDIANAIARVEQATILQVLRVRSRWAGLRSFVADRTPCVGYDAAAPGFFWLAAQGGYGIQTAPAMGRLAAALVQALPLPDDLLRQGVDPARLSPCRLGRNMIPATCEEIAPTAHSGISGRWTNPLSRE